VAGGHIDTDSVIIRRFGDVMDGQIGSTFHYLFKPGQVLFVSARPYLRKTGVPGFGGVVADKTYVLEAASDNGLLNEMLPFVLTSDRFVEYATQEATGSMNPRLLWGAMQRYEFALPPLDEQKCITDLLWALEKHHEQIQLTAKAMRAARIGLLDRSTIDALGRRSVPLSEIAEIRGGIQKGKSATGPTIERPYLRVANVQSGSLDLSEIKTLAVSAGDADRYSLAVGDVLMTEGGDIDKLGRGAVWRGEIPGCLHQNHVFAIRIKGSAVSPYWISLHTESTHGRSYFRVAAKRTSNLASVNKTQVSAFPIGLLSAEAERAALEKMGRFDTALAAAENEIRALDALRSSLLTAIFRGN
jgi:type I restriction enzyme S subunit